MKSNIQPGDLVLFNPSKKFFACKQKILLGREDHIAIVLSVIPEDTYLISFEPSAEALVDISLIEKIEVRMKPETDFSLEEAWFKSYASFEL